MTVRFLLPMLLVLSAATARAQTVSTGISRDTVRVGDPVRVVVRVEGIPQGTEVLLADSLASGGYNSAKSLSMKMTERCRSNRPA